MNRPNLKTAIAGSFRSAVPDAHLISPSNPDQKIKISIYARRNPGPSNELHGRMEKLSTELPGKRKYLSPREFDELYGADPADLKKIEVWAKEHKLQVLNKSVSQRRVEVEGTIADISEALGVTFNEYEHSAMGGYRGRTGYIYTADDMHGIIEGIFGLDTRPVGRPRIRRGNRSSLPLNFIKPATGARTKVPDLTNKKPGTFFPPQVADLYKYPGDVDGTGEHVAIFAFNDARDQDKHGGYSLSALQEYYRDVLGQPTIPTIEDVVILGKGNYPGVDTEASENNGDATGEVMLDMSIVGSVAPGAKIFMYFTEFTSKGWVDAIHNAIAGDNDISVISISYGSMEQDKNSLWPKMAVKLVDQAFEAAASKGITICCASGDDGSNDEDKKKGPAEVDFPASSPNVLAVGGTKLVASKGARPSIVTETVWNELYLKDGGASGGGVSVVFSKPAYQDNAPIPVSVDPPHLIGRGVPDVSAVGDPDTGLMVMHVNGKKLDQVGGTSASAPLWASLIARLNQSMKARCGFMNPLLYTRFSSGVLRDIIKGNNGAYRAGKGWDACTGLGSPDGQKLLNALSGKSAKPSKKKKKP